MFVSPKVIFGKLLFKLSYACLTLGKIVNGKYFPVNGKHFPVKGKHFLVNKKYFPVKGKFGLGSRKVFSLLTMFVFRKVVSGKPLSKLSYVCLP